MGITKVQVAEREIVAAVRLFFDGDDGVPIYVLAAAAREITTTLCAKRGIRPFLEDVQEEHPHLSIDQLYRIASQHAGFFKHADRDPDVVLENFSDVEAEMVLFTAVHDFGRLCGGKPIEAQVFEAWFLALHLPDADLPGPLLDLLPSIKTQSRIRQIEMGKIMLAWAREQPEFQMDYTS